MVVEQMSETKEGTKDVISACTHHELEPFWAQSS